VRRLALSALVTIALAASPRTAGAKDDDKGRPFARGTFVPALSVGAGFSQDLTVIGVGLGASYFLVHGLAAGLQASNTFLIWSSGIKARYDGIEDEIPTNVVRLTPTLQYVFWRSRWFSPYVLGGLGPVFFNHGGGTLGEWTAAPGALIGLGGPVYLDLGVAFSGIFPRADCDAAFSYTDTSDPPRTVSVEGFCGFRWGPRLGFLFSF
jgi:hypothetical protein